VIGDDHPRACTGRRLLRLGLVEVAPASPEGSWVPIVLDPYATDPLSRADVGAAERSGILAVDCSWNRLGRRGRLPWATGWGRSIRRRLPFLMATNPQHFGRLAELNTAEAIGAALYLLGREREAADLLAGFAGGRAFLEVNLERLQRFAEAPDAEASRALERSLYAPAEPRSSTGERARE
jgi:pre-rRNA-processing protein TSR3